MGLKKQLRRLVPPALPVQQYDPTTGTLTRAPQAAPMSFKEGIDHCLANIGTEGLLQWAEHNPGHFLSLASKTLPLELQGKNGGPVEITFIDPTVAAKLVERDVTPAPTPTPTPRIAHGK